MTFLFLSNASLSYCLDLQTVFRTRSDLAQLPLTHALASHLGKWDTASLVSGSALASPPCLLLPRTRRESTCFLIPAPGILSPPVANDQGPMRVEEFGAGPGSGLRQPNHFIWKRSARWRYFVMAFIRILQGNMKTIYNVKSNSSRRFSTPTSFSVIRLKRCFRPMGRSCVDAAF